MSIKNCVIMHLVKLIRFNFNSLTDLKSRKKKKTLTKVTSLWKEPKESPILLLIIMLTYNLLGNGFLLLGPKAFLTMHCCESVAAPDNFLECGTFIGQKTPFASDIC